MGYGRWSMAFSAESERSAMNRLNTYFELAWHAIISLSMVIGGAIIMGGVLAELWDSSVARRRRNKIKLLQRENAMLSKSHDSAA